MFAQDYSITYKQNGGNPKGLNTQADNAFGIWTRVQVSGLSTNVWTSRIKIPFGFKFYDQTMDSIRISLNGIITFKNDTLTPIPSENTSKVTGIFWVFSIPNLESIPYTYPLNKKKLDIFLKIKLGLRFTKR